MIIIAYECFKLVFVLPERVMNWASAGVQSYGEGGIVDKQQGGHDKAKQHAGQIDSAHRSGFGKK